MNGGLDEAVKQVFDAEVAWHCEWDEAPSKILAHHYPDVPNYRDVTQIDWETVPPVDIITAGYPCQPFSKAGHRKGTTDERHLWPYVLNAIRALRPHIVILENVAGHLNLGMDTVLADLAASGFDAQWATLRASDIGAPHHRERLFILAYANGQRPQTQRFASRQAQKVPRDHDLHDTLAGLARTSDLKRECRLRWGDAGARILDWAIITGHDIPFPTHAYVSYHDEELWGRRFPEVKHGTNPVFVEWMMGLPDGWVTSPEIGLTRAQQLKAIGNGVCPQQAATALKHLLEELNSFIGVE